MIRTAPHDLAPPLLTAVAGGDEAVAAMVEDVGRGEVACVLMAELASRCAAGSSPPEPVVAHFEVMTDRGSLWFSLTLDTDYCHLTSGRTAAAAVLARQELVALARQLYGSQPEREPAEIQIMADPIAGSTSAGYWAAAFAAARIEAACSAHRPSLSELAVRYGSDKWGAHWYTRHYERHFSALRDEPVTLLEIGIGGYDDPSAGGASLRMWKQYFRRGLVYGLDLHDKTGLAGETRVSTVVGDQADTRVLDDLVHRSGPLDIVIDDGSHRSADVIATFGHLFRRLRPGGFYAIEDLHTSYWTEYGGNPRELCDPATTTGFLKTLIDGLHHADRPAVSRPSYLDRHVRALHLYHNVALIEKGPSAEGAHPVARSPQPGRATRAAGDDH